MSLRMPQRSVAPLVLANVLGTCLAQALGQSIVLEPKYPPGQTLYSEQFASIEFVIAGGAVQDVDAEGIKALTEFRLGLLRTVQSASADGVTLRLTLDRVAVKFEMALLPPMAFDSDGVDPPEGTPALERALRPLIGMSYTLALNGKHKVVRTEGLDEIRAVLDKNGASLPPVSLISTLFSEKSVRRDWGEERMVLFPMKSVRIGESWSRSIDSELGSAGQVQTDYRCKLDRIVKDGDTRLGLVSFISDVRTAADAKPLKAPDGSDMKLKDGRLTGHAAYDIVLGEYVESVADGAISFQGQPRSGALPFRADVRLSQSSIVMSPDQRSATRGQPQDTTPVSSDRTP
ncbi:MAG: hypothetical protein HRF50_12780 [Phycisphaerae bacterium]